MTAATTMATMMSRLRVLEPEPPLVEGPWEDGEEPEVWEVLEDDPLPEVLLGWETCGIRAGEGVAVEVMTQQGCTDMPTQNGCAAVKAGRTLRCTRPQLAMALRGPRCTWPWISTWTLRPAAHHKADGSSVVCQESSPGAFILRLNHLGVQAGVEGSQDLQARQQAREQGQQGGVHREFSGTESLGYTAALGGVAVMAMGSCEAGHAVRAVGEGKR